MFKNIESLLTRFRQSANDEARREKKLMLSRKEKFEKIINRRQANALVKAPASYEAIWERDKYSDCFFSWKIRNLWLLVHSRHTVFLEITMLIIGMVLAFLLYKIFFDGLSGASNSSHPIEVNIQINGETSVVSRPLNSKSSVAVSGMGGVFSGKGLMYAIPAVVALIAILQFIYSIGIKRRGTASLIVGEIVSIVRVYASANIIGEFVKSYAVMDELKRAAPSSFGDVAKEENYYMIFEKSIESLGSFDRKLVGDISAFYTFLKAARDATGTINLWNDKYPIEQSKEDVINIIYLCFLQLMHGHFSVDLTVEKANKKFMRWAGDVFSGVEIQCFCFLMMVLKEGDFRYAAVEARYLRYEKLSREFGYKDMFSVIGKC